MTRRAYLAAALVAAIVAGGAVMTLAPLSLGASWLAAAITMVVVGAGAAIGGRRLAAPEAVTKALVPGGRDLDPELRSRMVGAIDDPEPAVAGAARAAIARARELTPRLADDHPAAVQARAAGRDPIAREAAAAALVEHDGARAAAVMSDRGLDRRDATGERHERAGVEGRARERHEGAGGEGSGGGRARERYDTAVAAALAAGGARRLEGLIAATAGGDASVRALIDALMAGERDAVLAIATVDAAGARNLHAELPLLAADERAAIARARAADEPDLLLATLADDDDEDVRAAALRSLAGQARAGAAPPAELCARLIARERAAVVALTAVRPAPGDGPVLHAAEVDRALHAALERLLQVIALASAAAGRPAAPVLAAGRRLLASPEAARRRAVDVLRERTAGDAAVLDAVDAIGRALRPPTTADPRARSLIDPWLAELLAGAHSAREPALAALRACRFAARLPGRHADDLAARAGRRFLAPGDVLVRAGDRATATFTIVSGALAGARGPVIGEAALVDDTAHAASLRATALTELLVIDRATFAAALRRWPELALDLCRALATDGADRMRR